MNGRRRLALAVAALASGAGCAGILGIPGDVERAEDGGAALADASDAASTDGAGSDAEPDAPVDAPVDAPPPCDLSKDFAAPVLLASISTAEQEGSPRFSEDELTVYFDGVRTATGDTTFGLFTAKRNAIDDTFGQTIPVPGDLDTKQWHEYAPNVTPDGLRIFFERQELASENDDFWTASRSDPSSPFTGATQVAGINTPEYEGKLFVRGDGSEIYFVKMSTGRYDLHVAKKVQGTYVVTRLANVNSPADDYAPVVSKNGLVLYFSSLRVVNGKRDENIWVATRASISDDFGPPAYVTNVNLPDTDEEPGWISNDQCRLYLTSDRPGKGQQDIYVATRPK